MFSKTNKDQESQAAPAQNQQKRPTRNVPSLISVDLAVVGSMTAGGEIQIDGKVDGDITAGSLTVGEKATVTGEIMAEEVIVRGRIIGSIRARKVQLCATSHVEGDIYHQALAVENGAYFEGNCRHSDDPLKEGRKGASASSGDSSRRVGQGTPPRPDAQPAALTEVKPLAAPAAQIPAAPAAPLPAPRVAGGLLGRPGPVQINRARPGSEPEAATGGKGK